MKNMMNLTIIDSAKESLTALFDGLLTPVWNTPSFREAFIEGRNQFTAEEVMRTVDDYNKRTDLFNRIIVKCGKDRNSLLIQNSDDRFSFIRMILQAIIMKDGNEALYQYKQSMLYRYFELCSTLKVTPMFNWDKETHFYRHVQTKFLNSVNRADFEVSSDLIKQGVDLDIRVNGAGDSLLTLLVKLRQKSLRECRASKEEAPRNNAVTYMKLLHQVLEKGVSLSTLFRDVTILDELNFTTNQLIAYFARSVDSPNEVLDALRPIQSKEDLKYLKGWLLQSLKQADVEYYFAVSNNYLSMSDNMVLLRILRTGRSTLEMKDTESYVQFIEMMQKVQYQGGALLASLYRQDEPKTVQLYEAYLRELSRSEDSLNALRQRIIADEAVNMPAVLCYLMRAKSIELEPDQFERVCANVPVEALNDRAVKACLTAGSAIGAHRSLKANLLAYFEQNLDHYRERLQGELALEQPATWVVGLLNLRASHFDRGNTPSYEKLRVMLDPAYQPQSRWLRFTFRRAAADPHPVNALELPQLNIN